MSVRIRLKRFGAKRRPYYRLVVVDSRVARDSRAIEELGSYSPAEGKGACLVKTDRVNYWLSKGARPSDTVRRLLNKQDIRLPS